MRYLYYALIVFAFAFLATPLSAQNPFDSSKPGYPKRAPFTAFEWKDDTTVRVQVDEQWYELKSIEGVTVEELLAKCKTEDWNYRKRIGEDLIQLLRLMGQDPSNSVKLGLIDDSGKEIISQVNASKDNHSKIQAALFAEAMKANPFFSGAPDYPDRSPFTEIKWSDGKPQVKFRNQWYQPISLHGVTFDEIVAQCKDKRWDLEHRFTEDMVQILRLMGQDIDKTIDMELLDSDGKSHRFEAIEMTNRSLRLPRENRGSRSTGKFDIDSIHADLDSLQHQLEAQFAYLKANDFDYVAAIDKIRANATDLNSESKLALAIEKNVVNQFIDGHASVSGGGVSGESFLPFLVEVSGDRYVAIKEDRQAFVDPTHPYIEKIDGKSIDEWIKIAAVYSPKGSPQYVRRHGLRMLRVLPQLRADPKLPESNTLSVMLAQKNADKTVTRKMDLSDDYPTYGLWPRQTESRLLDGYIGYLRIPRMNEDAVESIQRWMPKFKDTRGLIVDVRGNGGGIRTPLIELAGYLMRAEDQPRIGNVARYRLCDEFEKDHLSDSRHVYRETNSKFDDRERATIAAFKKKFQPEWEPDDKEFSEWHYMVLAKRPDDKRYFYDKSVIVLCDEKCFSATDIFLGALKGWPNVTLMGQPSGGGSVSYTHLTLPTKA